ncbi:hypothetical protein AMJ71_03675, partial [candidate division TA06 bacterium SM1_40]
YVCSECGRVFNLVTKAPARKGLCDACGGKLIQREDDRRETVAERLRVYNEQTDPLRGFYRQRSILAAVDGNGTLEEVYGRIRREITRGISP